MANPYYVSPMGGFNLGGALNQLGQQFGQQRKEQQAQQDMEQTRAFALQAQSGDPAAMKELFARQPNLALKLQEMDAQRTANMTAQQKMIADKANLEYANAYKIAKTPEERQAVMNRAITDPESDLFDEGDVGRSEGELSFDANMALYAGLGDKQYSSMYGGGEVKTRTIQTPTGALVVDEQTGETVKDIVIPEKKAEFEASKKERQRKINQEKAKELSRIKNEKIKKQDAAEARKDAISTTVRAFELTKELGDESVIAPVTGWWDRMTATGNKSQDVINKALELKDLLTLNNLGLMSGVLTDRDIAILARAGSGLNVDEDGFLGSEKGVVNQIKKVERMMDDKLKSAVKRGDLSQLDYESIISPEPETNQKGGTIKVDADGNRAIVYPNGTYKEL